MSFDLEALIENEGRLFSLPELAIKINSIVNDPEGTFEDLSDVISQDVGLSTHLLKIVNSGLYHFQAPVETITHAISVVGMTQLRDLAMGTIVIKAFNGIPNEVVSVRSFWEHSIATGIAAKTIAIYRKEASPERFYIAGLLHEIGRLVICAKYQEKAKQIMELSHSERRPMYMAENDMLEIDHCAVGAALLASWNLPEYQQEVVRYHHSPLASKKFSIEASIVHVGDIIAHILNLGNSGEHYIPPLDVKALERLGISTDMLSPIFCVVEEQYDEIVATYFN